MARHCIYVHLIIDLLDCHVFMGDIVYIAEQITTKLNTIVIILWTLNFVSHQWSSHFIICPLLTGVHLRQVTLYSLVHFVKTLIEDIERARAD